MPDKSPSELDPITSLGGTEEFVVALGGLTKKITASDALANASWDALIVKSGDESATSDIVLSLDSELRFTTVSGGFYQFEFFIIYASPVGGGTPDLKYTIGELTSVHGTAQHQGLTIADALNVGGMTVDTDATAVTVGTATTNRSFTCTGHFWGAAGGSFGILWAQNTSGINPTIVRAGSLLRYRRIL